MYYIKLTNSSSNQLEAIICNSRDELFLQEVCDYINKYLKTSKVSVDHRSDDLDEMELSMVNTLPKCDLSELGVTVAVNLLNTTRNVYSILKLHVGRLGDTRVMLTEGLIHIPLLSLEKVVNNDIVSKLYTYRDNYINLNVTSKELVNVLTCHLNQMLIESERTPNANN